MPAGLQVESKDTVVSHGPLGAIDRHDRPGGKTELHASLLLGHDAPDAGCAVELERDGYGGGQDVRLIAQRAAPSHGQPL